MYQHIRFIVCCSYVSFVCILCFYPVALCIVVFCCFPLVAVGDILSASAYFWAVFSVWGFVPPLVFEALTSFCWGFVLMLYQGFVLVFYIEASSSYFILRLWPRIILRLCPHILFWGFGLVFYLRLRPHILHWGFILIFYFEASASYFILRLRPHILYWGFVLILYFKASSSWLIWGFVLIVIYWGYVPQFEALVVIVVGPCCFVCTAYLVCLHDMCVVLFVCFLSRVTRCKYYLVWISIPIFNLLCLIFFSLHSCNPLFWFTCSYYFSLNFIRLLRVVITPSVTTRNNRMNLRLLLF